MTRNNSNNRLWVILTILVITIVFTRIVGANVVYVYDDAFITFRYAKNLATGNGFVYNPGEKILGTTSPLFGIIQAGIYRTGGNLPKTVQGLNIITDLLTVGVVLLSVWQFDLLAGVIFGLIYAAEMWIIRISIGGMEMSLFTALSFVAIYLFSIRRKKTAIFLASTSYFLRPEGIILAGLLTIFTAKDNWKKFLKSSLIPIFTIGFPLLAIWVYYGSPIPQSVATKSEMIGGSLWYVIQRQYFQNVFHWLLFPFTLVGAFQIFSKEKFFGEDEAISFQAIVLCWGILYSLAYIFARPYIWSWYLFPVYAAKFFVASIGISYVVVWGKAYSKEISIEKLAISGGLAIIIIYTGALVWFGSSSITKEVYVPMQKWISSLPKNGHGKKILAEDIGAIGFYSDAYIYDAAGLVLKKSLRGRSEIEIIDGERPDFVLTNASICNAGLIQKMQRGGYKMIDSWPKKVSVKKLNAKWKQEYLLFARN